MIAIIDYGVGNLFSLSSSLNHIGVENCVTADADVLRQASHIILPGVGAFGDAIAKLRATGLVEPLHAEVASGKPLLGICLGMQLLFTSGSEYGEHEGLGFIKGHVGALQPKLDAVGSELKVPHMGWNALHICKPENPLMKYVREGDCVYYVHSFYAQNCAEHVVASSEYGIDVVGAVSCENVYGCQFHPEKSGKIGLEILRAFSEI